MMKIIFLHGLLGTGYDWQKVIENLPHFCCIPLDLPFHGKAKNIEVSHFNDTAKYLSEQIKTVVNNEPYVLVGYSLGGRVAMYYALEAHVEKGNLQAVVLEGANLGLKTEEEKQARWQNDAQWATRFAKEAPEKVLKDWYQQPVFSHLTADERAKLIEKRKANCGENIGKMLLATSLAKQPDFREKVRSSSLPFFYFCGEQDSKFQTLAQAEQLNLTTIAHAGHNAHLENPTLFAKKLDSLISKLT
ncbi:2-succinyl-6-hydroxy-2,4-cyclohexadiene-1-carboxylate synthase [Rodentibacter trehalosifermentans]|uniref:Putative 2-succinyl-6-hydroxy-2,4-cyclohexadiene-1-carboxylate synthase n=1 Tax=Rodentibacter trehalosifermentans TaxID=1908263 RepID=A0A1V3IU64_9PAST|nr:2-succinyl-6-hydroxy-2,4-cyclohexadiene-1-carboxylate synthase [Rodentibacter trehalosifermentans]OOF45641.1 2-succinyl-6-hydroxy-2,4-cyclohexadiene-1-carboxylate synthase [Rodentibacter trehalosifermentans]OOF47373.1 2-succinyl-6-hydroxy-2,4-cyclohexadiene-1-carboxylate synthase [Rodentibacter trehalosifermentans]